MNVIGQNISFYNVLINSKLAYAGHLLMRLILIKVVDNIFVKDKSIFLLPVVTIYPCFVGQINFSESVGSVFQFTLDMNTFSKFYLYKLCFMSNIYVFLST